MVYIPNSNNEKERLDALIQEQISKYIENNGVLCIYRTCFIDDEGQKIIYITVITDYKTVIKDFKMTKNKTDVDIIPGFTIVWNFVIRYVFGHNGNAEMDPYYYRDLLNSKILFDRYGEYKDIYERNIDKCEKESYSNLWTFEEPLMLTRKDNTQ